MVDNFASKYAALDIPYPSDQVSVSLIHGSMDQSD